MVATESWGKLSFDFSIERERRKGAAINIIEISLENSLCGRHASYHLIALILQKYVYSQIRNVMMTC